MSKRCERKAGSATQCNAHPTDVHKSLAAADGRCRQLDLRMTPVRRKVLEILLQDDRALGAYAILDVLRASGLGSQPPVVYRALDFLCENGFAHRIERLNAFVACSHPSETHSPAFLICRVCDTVSETDSTPSETGLGSAARESGFHIERTVVEAEGICPECAETAAT